MKQLRGRAVIVTGAGRGIGAAAARLLANMGAALVINDIDADAAAATAALVRADGGAAIADGSDVADWDESGRLVSRCQQSFGTVDGLVNNAAVFAMGRLDEMERGEFDRLLEVNVVGTANCAAHAVKPMLAQQRGSIVNVTSGAHMGIGAMGAYGATKGAVASLTYIWAEELKGTGVRVNAVSPMANTAMADIAADYQLARGQVAPRPSASSDANAPLIAYLLSDAAAKIHGQIVRIAGEQLALMAHPAVMLPILERADGWTFEALDGAFARDLDKRQAPVGITGVEIARYGLPSSSWTEQAPD